MSENMNGKQVDEMLKASEEVAYEWCENDNPHRSWMLIGGMIILAFVLVHFLGKAMDASQGSVATGSPVVTDTPITTPADNVETAK